MPLLIAPSPSKRPEPQHSHTGELLGRQNSDPILLVHCVSALLRANQCKGSRCHVRNCYGFPLVLNHQANLHITLWK